MSEQLPEHSELGASSAERWMNCPGSVTLIKQLEIRETTDDPEYRRAGTLAHWVAANCLTDGKEPWEFIGDEYEGVTVDQEMADAVQAFVDECAPILARADHKYIEYKMHHPDFHKDFYGTVDFAAIINWDSAAGAEGTDGIWLIIRDFKYGQGVVVESFQNVQMMYYAYGILRLHPEVQWIDMRIVQPRVTWSDSDPYIISADELREWARNTLKPAMLRTESDSGLMPGDHCRFCPAKLVCPALKGLFGTAAKADARQIVHLTNEELAREYPMIDGVKKYIKALEDETFTRLSTGNIIASAKLVKKKANRVWKPEAEALFKARWGDEVYEAPVFKSPAEMEKLGAGAKDLVHEYAYTPESGLTVALKDDKRPEVKVQPASALLTPKE